MFFFVNRQSDTAVINKYLFHPILHNCVCDLHYERICARKAVRSRTKHKGLSLSASMFCKCIVQGQNATVQFGTNISVQSRLFRVKMVALYTRSNFQCHNVTVQGRKCTVPIKCNDAF